MKDNSRDLDTLSVTVQPNFRSEIPQEQASVFPTVIGLILAVVVNVMVLTKVDLPIFRPAAGFWFMIILPSYLLFTTSAWRRCRLEERLGYSVCTALLILMLTALIVNEILPLMRVQRPLDAYSVLIVGDLINLSLYALRTRYPERVRMRVGFASVGKEEFRLFVMASLSVALVIFGANRLNNGVGGQPTLIALGIVALIIALSLRWIRFVREFVMSAVIYLISLSLLLSTSLRGWYVTGHDIQEEYQVFQLTEARGHWSMAYFHNAYNACLSITILPTELGQIINVDNPYVYKVFFQLIFALCPVLVYAISRRYFDRSTSILSVTVFIGFPTFFTDMPFLNRQEIGLLFVAVGVLAVTNPIWNYRRRQLTLGLAGLGVEVAHYSSMYVFLGILVIAWLCRNGVGLLTRPFPAWLDLSRRRVRWAPGAGISVTVGPIIVLVGIIFLWGGLATGTSGQVVNDGRYAIAAGDFTFSLFNSLPSPENELLQEYREATLRSRAGNQGDIYLPTSAVSKASTPVVAQQIRPLTKIGRDLNALGIPVIFVNSLARNLVAYGFELFLAVGLIRLLVVRRQQRRRIGQQFFWLSVGGVCMVGLITVIPSLSTEYGPLRSFQEGLIIFAPVVAIGSITLFEWLGKRLAMIVAGATCLGLFVITSTLVPQILGGNLAELNLNNSGTYYDLYFTSPGDEAAITWLGEQPDVLSYPIQTTYAQSKFLFTSWSDVNGNDIITDAYPTLVLRNSWLILGGTVGSSGLAYTFIPSNGALIEYKYPTGLLYNNKDLVYTDGSAKIYK